MPSKAKRICLIILFIVIQAVSEFLALRGKDIRIFTTLFVTLGAIIGAWSSKLGHTISREIFLHPRGTSQIEIYYTGDIRVTRT